MRLVAVVGLLWCLPHLLVRSRAKASCAATIQFQLRLATCQKLAWPARQGNGHAACLRMRDQHPVLAQALLAHQAGIERLREHSWGSLLLIVTLHHRHEMLTGAPCLLARSRLSQRAETLPRLHKLRSAHRHGQQSSRCLAQGTQVVQQVNSALPSRPPNHPLAETISIMIRGQVLGIDWFRRTGPTCSRCTN